MKQQKEQIGSTRKPRSHQKIFLFFQKHFWQNCAEKKELILLEKSLECPDPFCTKPFIKSRKQKNQNDLDKSLLMLILDLPVKEKRQADKQKQGLKIPDMKAVRVLIAKQCNHIIDRSQKVIRTRLQNLTTCRNQLCKGKHEIDKNRIGNPRNKQASRLLFQILCRGQLFIFLFRQRICHSGQDKEQRDMNPVNKHI